MSIRQIAALLFFTTVLVACVAVPRILPTATILPAPTFTPSPTAKPIPATPTEELIEPQLDQEIQIRLGESIVLEKGTLTIKFISLEGDSRGPEGALCVWQGNAEIIVDVSGNEVSLNTSLEPKEAVVGAYIIRLQDVIPYPKMDEIHAPEDYSIKIIVSRK